MNIKSLTAASAFVLLNAASFNAAAQAPFPANEQMCLLYSGMAGEIAVQREKGITEDELLKTTYYATKDMKDAAIGKDSLAIVQYVFKEKLRPMEARKDVYFMCKTGSYSSARLPI